MKERNGVGIMEKKKSGEEKLRKLKTSALKNSTLARMRINRIKVAFVKKQLPFLNRESVDQLYDIAQDRSNRY